MTGTPLRNTGSGIVTTGAGVSLVEPPPHPSNIMLIMEVVNKDFLNGFILGTTKSEDLKMSYDL